MLNLVLVVQEILIFYISCEIKFILVIPILVLCMIPT